MTLDVLSKALGQRHQWRRRASISSDSAYAVDLLKLYEAEGRYP